MTAPALARLHQLALADATLAPLIALQTLTLSAVSEASWQQAIPDLNDARLDEGIPALHGRTLTPAADQLARLAKLLTERAEQCGITGASALGDSLSRGHIDPLMWIEASFAHDSARIEALAELAGAGSALMMMFGQLLVVPLARAAAAASASRVDGLIWEAGYCPICAGWATLAEQRGLARERWLRCGRCGTGWRFPHLQCVYCANIDERTQGYLAPEADRASRIAVTCDRCHGYIKTMSAFGATPPDDLIALDLSTLELDIAALSREYGRPERLGFPLDLRITGAVRPGGWLSWRR